MRKDFTMLPQNELEELVNQLDPTAEFNRTMIAEEYRQSQSVDTPYTTDYMAEDNYDDLDE